MDEEVKLFKEDIKKKKAGNELIENIDIQLEMLKDGDKFEKLLEKL